MKMIEIPETGDPVSMYEGGVAKVILIGDPILSDTSGEWQVPVGNNEDDCEPDVIISWNPKIKMWEEIV